jgi:BirA family biotin operon repressor/biotin-[acetyl-CoA-carboxylase] ligase
VASTNIECMERARAGDPGGLWVTANRQTGGRGRRGRPWVSEPGNLYASLLLIDPAPRGAMASLPLAVTVAVYDAVAAVLPGDRAISGSNGPMTC